MNFANISLKCQSSAVYLTMLQNHPKRFCKMPSRCLFSCLMSSRRDLFSPVNHSCRWKWKKKNCKIIIQLKTPCMNFDITKSLQKYICKLFFTFEIFTNTYFFTFLSNNFFGRDSMVVLSFICNGTTYSEALFDISKIKRYQID